MAKTKEKKQSVGVGVYDIEKFLPGRWGSSAPRDPLDEVLQLQAKDLARKAKSISVEAYIAGKKKEIADIKGSSGNPGAVEDFTKLLMTDPKTQTQWLSYTDQQRAILITGMQALKSRGESNSGLSGLVPFLMMSMNARPNMGVKELLEIISVIRPVGNPGKSETSELIKALTPFIQGSGSKGSVTEAISTLIPIFNQMAQKDQQLYMSQLKRLESQIVSPIEVLKSIAGNAELLGYSKTGNSSLEVERFKAETSFKLQQINFEHQKWRDDQELKKMSERDRWNAITQIGTKWMDKASPIIDAGINAAQKRILANASNPGLAMLSCVSCGTSISISGEPDVVNCPSCGLAHKKNLDAVEGGGETGKES